MGDAPPRPPKPGDALGASLRRGDAGGPGVGPRVRARHVRFDRNALGVARVVEVVVAARLHDVVTREQRLG